MLDATDYGALEEGVTYEEAEAHGLLDNSDSYSEDYYYEDES